MEVKINKKLTVITENRNTESFGEDENLIIILFIDEDGNSLRLVLDNRYIVKDLINTLNLLLTKM